MECTSCPRSHIFYSIWSACSIFAIVPQVFALTYKFVTEFHTAVITVCHFIDNKFNPCTVVVLVAEVRNIFLVRIQCYVKNYSIAGSSVSVILGKICSVRRLRIGVLITIESTSQNKAFAFYSVSGNVIKKVDLRNFIFVLYQAVASKGICPVITLKINCSSITYFEVIHSQTFSGEGKASISKRSAGQYRKITVAGYFHTVYKNLSFCRANSILYIIPFISLKSIRCSGRSYTDCITGDGNAIAVRCQCMICCPYNFFACEADIKANCISAVFIFPVVTHIYSGSGRCFSSYGVIQAQLTSVFNTSNLIAASLP